MADEVRSPPKVAVARSSSAASECSPVTARREKARAGGGARPSLPRVLDFREDIIDGFAIVSFTDVGDLEAFTSSGCMCDSTGHNKASVSSSASQEDSDDGNCSAPAPPLPPTLPPPCPYSEISAVQSSCSEDENENEPPKIAKRKPPFPHDSSSTATAASSSQETNLCSCISATTGRHLSTTTSSVSLLHPSESNNKTTDVAASAAVAASLNRLSDLSSNARSSPLPVCFNILSEEKSMVGLPSSGCSSSLDYLSSAADEASPSLVTAWRCNGDDIVPGKNGSAATVNLHGSRPSPASEKASVSSEVMLPSSRPISVDDDREERLTPVSNGSMGDSHCRLSPKKRVLDEAGENRRKVPVLDREERFRYYSQLVDVGGSQVDHTKVKQSLTPSSLANCDETKIKSKKSKLRDLPECHALQNSRVQGDHLPGVIATSTGLCTTESQPLATSRKISSPFSSRLGQNSSNLSSGASIPCKSEHRSDISGSWSSSRTSATRSVDLVTSPKRSNSCASTQVKPSNSQDDPVPPPVPERESVIVREHSGHHHRPAPSSSVKRECHSPIVGSSYKTSSGSRNSSELRTPVSASLPHNSTASTCNFPLFSVFNKGLPVNSHPIYLPAPHPAFPSNFSASGLPFSLPPFQRAGMFASSLGFPPSSSLVTSPLMGFASHFHPETMLSLSAAPSQEILTRLQQELNTRFLQDRGILPMAPFTLHAEMHQHQHLHHHQHLLPGNYLPPPANPLLSSDALTIGKLPPGGGLLQSSQNLSEFLEREQLAKAAGLPSYSSFHSLPLVGGLPTAMPFGSGLSGAFQPKPGLSSLNLTPATQLLLSLRDRDPFSAPANQLPSVPKKRGQWCAAHIQIAWKIYKMKQCQPDDSPRSLSSLKSLDRDRHPNHSYLLSSGGSGGSMLGDVRSSALIDSGLPPPFGRPTNFGGYDSLDLPFARKHAFDSTLNPSLFRSSGWNGLAPPPAPPQPSLASGGWTKLSGDGSRESSGPYDRILEQKERGSSLNHKTDTRGPGRDLHKDSDLGLSSRPTSHSNSVTHDRKRSPTSIAHQPHKENGQFRSRSRSPLQFPTSRSYAPPNGPAKQSRDPEDMLWKPELRVDGFPNFRMKDSSATSHSSLPPTDPYSILGKTVETVPHPIDLQHLSMAREPVLNQLNDFLARDQLMKDQAIFADFDRRRQAIPPPLRSADLYFGHVYKSPSDRLYPRDSPLPLSGGMGLPPPLVGASCSRPSSPISSLNHWMANGRSNSIASSASLIEIPNDGGRILR